MNTIKQIYARVETDQIKLHTKEQDLKVLSQEIGALKSKIRNDKSKLAMEIAQRHGNKLVFNCGDYVLILKSERCEKSLNEPEHKSYLLIVEQEPFANEG